MSKRKRPMISDWTAMITIALVVASYIWYLSAKFSSLEHGLQRLGEKVDDLIIEVKTTNANLDNVEHRVDQLEKKSP